MYGLNLNVWGRIHTWRPQAIGLRLVVQTSETVNVFLCIFIFFADMRVLMTEIVTCQELLDPKIYGE